MSQRILIVDDSASTRAIIQRIIAMTGVPAVDIHEASDGRQALDLLAHIPIDLVLTDLNMPVMDGSELIRRMHDSATLRDVPIVVISAQPNLEERVSVHSNAIHGYISKPFTPGEIREIIHPILCQPAGVKHGVD